jgi:hypothetical protein
VFKFWFQKFLWHFSFPLAFLMFVGVLAYAVYTETRLTEAGDVAPFYQTLQTETPTATGFQALPIDQPNLTARELSEWVNTAISEILTFSAADFDSRLTQNKSFFTEAGYQQFSAYLQETDIRAVLTSQGLKTNVFIDAPPLLLNDGAVNGVYRWLYDVPVTLTYIPQGTQSYTAQTNSELRKVNVRIQIGRVTRADDPEAVGIESWVVIPRRDPS